MNTDKKIAEAFLNAFLEMSCSIRGNRLLKHFSFNEMVVCNLLLSAKQQNQTVYASQICDQLHLFKSQAARILASLEKKGLISRIPSPEDKRKLIIVFREEKLDTYSTEHEHVLKIVDRVHSELGTEQLITLTRLMHQATMAAIKEETE